MRFSPSRSSGARRRNDRSSLPEVLCHALEPVDVGPPARRHGPDLPGVLLRGEQAAGGQAARGAAMRIVLFALFCVAIVGANALLASLVRLPWSQEVEFAVIVAADCLLTLGAWQFAGELARKIEGKS